MRRVLITGMSVTGKSTVLRRLAELGYRVIDTDEGGFTVSVQSASGTERLWREDRIQAILSAFIDADVMFVSGTCRNQVRFYPQFDRIVLLSAPASVLGRPAGHAHKQSVRHKAGGSRGDAALRRDRRAPTSECCHVGA